MRKKVKKSSLTLFWKLPRWSLLNKKRGRKWHRKVQKGGHLGVYAPCSYSPRPRDSPGFVSRPQLTRRTGRRVASVRYNRACFRRTRARAGNIPNIPRRRASSATCHRKAPPTKTPRHAARAFSFLAGFSVLVPPFFLFFYLPFFGGAGPGGGPTFPVSARVQRLSLRKECV